MPDLGALGRLLIFIGVSIALIGGVLVLIGRLPGLSWLGRLPGDVYIERKNFSLYFPIATSLIISVALSLILWFLIRR